MNFFFSMFLHLYLELLILAVFLYNLILESVHIKRISEYYNPGKLPHWVEFAGGWYFLVYCQTAFKELLYEEKEMRLLEFLSHTSSLWHNHFKEAVAIIKQRFQFIFEEYTEKCFGKSRVWNYWHDIEFGMKWN